MGISDVGIVRAFKEKLRFHEQRQKVLAENVANASTPGYRGRDLKSPDFFRMAAEVRPDPGVLPVRTDARHIPGAPLVAPGPFDENKVAGYETTPDGNEVVLEEQMMKVSQNQMDYQVASSLYQRSLGLLRTAIGR